MPDEDPIVRGGSDFMVFPGDIVNPIGGLRVDHNIRTSWDIKPSIGIVAKDVDFLALALESFKEPLERSVKDVVIPSIQQNFDEGGRPPWEPLSEDTLAMRNDEGKILVRTGALEGAATSFDIWAIGNTSATVRSLPPDVWYGYVHQEGASVEGNPFGVHVSAAKSQLGSRANGMEIIRHAFKLMDEATGGPRGEGGGAINIPQRRFIMLQDEDDEKIELVFYEWVVKKTIEVGRWGGAEVFPE